MAVPVGLTFRHTVKAQPYQRALRAAGLDPVNLTPDIPRPSLDGLRGLVLAGGGDIEPWRYGEENRSAKSPDPERDEMELRFVREALKADMPLFAICRGMQLLNVALGGSLEQDIGQAHTLDRVQTHSVAVESGSLLFSLVGNACQVNSRHHQALSRLGQGLIASATSSDGIIEATGMPGKRFVLAVQWHPEDLAILDPPIEPHLRLFGAFRDAVMNWKP